MLKVLECRDEVMERIEALAQEPELQDFRLGLGGSFARGANKKNSTIDLVLKAKTDNKSKVGTAEIVEFIKQYTVKRYANKFNVVWFDLLEQDDVANIEFAKEMGLEPNPMSVYGNIAEEVNWVDKEAGER